MTHDSADGWRKDIPEGLETGLRNYWYPIALSDEVPADKPRAVTVLCEDLVIWRDTSGSPHTFRDSCPHRAVQLSAGKVLGDRIQCAYHGLEFDGNGRCVRIPWEGDDPKKCGIIAARAYPTAEIGGFVWSYIGDVDRFAPPPIEKAVPMEMRKDAFVCYGRRGIWEVNWLLAWDGSFDPQHNAFIHSGGVTVGRLGGREGGIYRMSVRQMQNGLKLQRLNDRGEIEKELAGGWMVPGMATLIAVYPDGPVVTRSWRLPQDVEHTHTVRCSSRLVRTAEEREAWHRMYHQRILPDSDIVNREDKAILRTQRGLAWARSNEQLLNSDVGVVHLRRLLKETFLAQQEGRRLEPDPWCPVLEEPWAGMHDETEAQSSSLGLV